MLNRYIISLLLITILASFTGSGPVYASQDTGKVRVYRVQLAASKTFIQPAYFKAKFKLDEEIEYFEKDGWFKYYVGDFNTEAEALEYRSETGEVGFVFSALIDKPVDDVIDYEDDVIAADNTVPLQADTLHVVLVETDSLNDLFNQKIRLADSAFHASDFELAKKLYTETSSMKPGLAYSGLQLEKIEKALKDGRLDAGDIKKGYRRLLLSLVLFFAAILLLWFVRRLILRKPVAGANDSENPDEINSGEVEQWLSGKKPFSFLGNTGRNLSAAEQVRLLDEMRRRRMHPPEFSQWLDSENISIVLFCLRMIRSYRQEDAYGPVVRLLDHDDEEVRAEAIVTLGEIGNRQVIGLLREKYVSESYTNRILILRAMGRMPDEANIDFLSELLKDPGDFRIEAAHALASVPSFGIAGVERVLKDLGADSELIARHILINKL